MLHRKKILSQCITWVFEQKKELYDWFLTEYPKHTSAKLDMGKSCIRFKKPQQIPYTLFGELAGKMTPAEWIEIYERYKR